MKVLCVLLTVLLCEAATILSPDQVIVSISIDSSSLEIQREALRLLTSIRLFGDTLNHSPIHVCINHDVEDDSNEEEISKKTYVLVEHIKSLNFEKIVISFSQSLPYPTYAPSLNKMCAFDLRTPKKSTTTGWNMEGVKFLLYLDADVFVAGDPLPLLAGHLPLQRGGETVMLCGRPFVSAHNEVDFAAFSGIPDNPFLNSTTYSLIPTLNGGHAYYGMCNTGVYFMELPAAEALSRMAEEYLARATTLSPLLPRNFLIDSFILWSAQQMLRYHVELFSLRLNYIVPVEDLYEPFWLEELSDAKHTAVNITDYSIVAQIMPVALFHFSRGSDMNFVEVASPSRGEDSCHLLLRSNSRRVSFTHEFFHSVFSSETGHLMCSLFVSVLEPFTEFVTARDDAATSYFRS